MATFGVVEDEGSGPEPKPGRLVQGWEDRVRRLVSVR